MNYETFLQLSRYIEAQAPFMATQGIFTLADTQKCIKEFGVKSSEVGVQGYKILKAYGQNAVDLKMRDLLRSLQDGIIKE